MTNNNQIPLEVKKPVETVYELKEEHKIPSYEEFMKTYNKDKEAVDSYENEFDSYGDIRIKGTYYGPGFWDDIKWFVKPVASGALIAASVFPPTAAIALPITVGVVGTGAVATGVGHATDSKGLKNFGEDLMRIAVNAKDGYDVADGSGLNAYARIKK